MKYVKYHIWWMMKKCYWLKKNVFIKNVLIKKFIYKKKLLIKKNYLLKKCIYKKSNFSYASSLVKSY